MPFVFVVSPRASHPNMGLRKRSSSMESLPTPDSVFENAVPPFWAVDRINRAHMCNESFRAAVDRSYEVPHLSQNMETCKLFTVYSFILMYCTSFLNRNPIIFKYCVSKYMCFLFIILYLTEC